MSFDMIRSKLASTTSDHYQNMKEVVDDIRLVFKNAYTFNLVGNCIIRSFTFYSFICKTLIIVMWTVIDIE